jgi:Trk-type K+ transport system membrane component
MVVNLKAVAFINGIAVIIGRLEAIPIFIVLSREFWRR